MDSDNNDLNWLNEFEQMADDTLGSGSACEQIHPIVEQWLEEWLESDMPTPRSAVSQAVACLATEVMNNTPQSILDVLIEHCDEDEVFQWVQSILVTGQAFQSALANGRLDDLLEIMAQKPNIAAQATSVFLQEKFDTAVTELTLLNGGDWSQAYSFVHDHKKYVLRWCYSSETFEKDAVASRFSCEAMPVPQIIEAGKYSDVYFAISEFAHGKFIDILSPDALETALPALFGLFDALRTADLRHTTGYGGWDKNGVGGHKSWKEYLLGGNRDEEGSFASGWHKTLANSTLGTTIFDQLYSQLESLVEKCPQRRELIHSDLLNRNLLISDNKISAVIDWQCSLYGDSLYDVAWFMFYAPWFPQFAAVQLVQKLIAHFESMSADNANLQARLLCYQLHIGLGSIVYNIFRQDWKAVQEVAEYTRQISHQATNI